MERFFTPSRRLQDYISTDEAHGYTEVELAVPTETFLNLRWDWSDFRAFATRDQGGMGTMIWITEDMFIYVEDDNISTEAEFGPLRHLAVQSAVFTSTSGETHDLVLLARVGIGYSEPLSVGATRVFWQAVTTSKCVKLKLENMRNGFELCSGPALSQFLETTPSLELIEFKDFSFEEADCRALTSLKRTGLEITFEECSFDAQGAEETCTEWLRHSQVVTKVDNCKMENSLLFSALNGNSSVKNLSMNATHGEFIMRDLAEVLPGNLGIVILRVVLSPRDGDWDRLLHSLWAHPRIQSLTLRFAPSLLASSKFYMMYEVLQLAQCNTVVHTIDLPDHAKDDEFYQNFIVPRLEMNRNCFEDQRQALTRADPAVRGRLLGRALRVVRNNPDLLFRFLSENVPAFVRSDEDGPSIPTGQKRKARS
jgi:hypothetical protein